MKAVVFLLCSPLSERDRLRFGYERWIAAGWRPIYFDCTPLLRPDFDRQFTLLGGLRVSKKNTNVIRLQTKAEVFNALGNLKGSRVCFVDLLSNSFLEDSIRLKAKKKGPLIQIRLTSLPFRNVNKPSARVRVLNLLKRPGRAAYQLARKWNLRPVYPDLLAVSGTAVFDTRDAKHSALVFAHNLDYDKVLEAKTKKEKAGLGKIVFVDTGDAYHSDYVALGIDPHVTPERYFEIMNRGLGVIGQKLEKDVIIAAHPRVDYSSKPFTFKFPVFYGTTRELIRACDVVISHGSTALNWAILDNKPIILVLTEEMREVRFAGHAAGFSDCLGIEVLFMDQISELAPKLTREQLNFVDRSRYSEYTGQFIKYPGSPEKPSWDIVIEAVESFQ